MSRIGKRYKDVLLSLASANNFDVGLGRLQMQKFVYLADSLSVIWDLLSPDIGFETYKHGPYDPAIQNAADVLVFRGAINISSSEIKPDGTVTAVYKISDVGLKIVKMMGTEPSLYRRAELYNLISTHVASRGWDKLRSLVYSDTTYLGKKMSGWGVSLNTNSLLSNDSLRTLLEYNNLVRNKELKLSKENLVAIYFHVLDNYLEIIQE